MNACLDILGVIDISHLTLNFIVKMGLYFTQQEMQQPVNKIYADNKHGLYEKDPETGKAKNRLDVIKRELKLNPNINLRICNRAMLEMRLVAAKMLELCKEVSPVLFKKAGASCRSLGYCPEGSKCCGAAPTLDMLLKAYEKVSCKEVDPMLKGDM